MTNPAIENRLDDYQEDQEDQETKSTARWDELPVDCLAQIFDDLLRAPTPHPSYLSGKLKVRSGHSQVDEPPCGRYLILVVPLLELECTF